MLESIINIGIECSLEKIILFGSRARGDHKERSDIDIAADGNMCEKFALEIEEKCPTLLKFDIVDMSKPISEELKDSIEKEGL